MTKEKSNNEEISLKDLKFSFDLKDCNYEMDILQNKLLEFYLRADPRFRQAFYMNYTSEFLQFIKDKTRLNEPIHISIMGVVRSGKSYSAISLCAFHQACYGKLFTADYICANAFEFLEKIRIMPQDKLTNRIFLIDEEVTALAGIGSATRKLHLQDVNNIIAFNNISTISLNPIKFPNSNTSLYGLRLFGRCFRTKTTRSMLYNLQESKSEMPLGTIYLPIFTTFLPKEYSNILEKKYLDKKKEWIQKEQRAESDIFAELRKKSAENFVKNEQYLNLKKKSEKITYISQILGSEWTKGEVEDVYNITQLLIKGIDFNK